VELAIAGDRLGLLYESLERVILLHGRLGLLRNRLGDDSTILHLQILLLETPGRLVSVTVPNLGARTDQCC
jgi:hypothetical protein